MATDVILLLNPTGADITTPGGLSVRSGEITSYTLTDTTTDLYSFVAQGCIAAPGALTNGTGSVSDGTDNLTDLVQNGAFKLAQIVGPFFSVNGDVWGWEGLNPGPDEGFIDGYEG